MLDFLVITLIILVITQWFQSKPFYWKNSGIPYSTPWPIFGTSIGFFIKPFYEVFADLYRKMGDSPLYGFHLFGNPALIVSSPEIVKKIMVSQNDHFMSHGFHTEPSYDPLGKSVFFVDGEEWKSVRGKLTPYFTPSRIKGMLPIVQPIMRRFADHVSEVGKRGPLNVQDASMRLAVDVVMSTVFGLQPESIDNPDTFFNNIQKELVSFMTGVKFLVGDLSPALYTYLGLSLLTKSTTQKLQQFVSDVIRERMNGNGNRPDFLQGMIELMQKEKLKETHKEMHNTDGTPVARFDKYSVTGQCMLMYLAGTETTGNTLSFLLYELALDQDMQDRARQEILSMIEKTNGNYGFDDLPELKFIHKLFYEAMRKYPVAATNSRKCTKAINIDGVDIPVGTKIMISAYAMHRNPKYFPEPERFNPERFSEEAHIEPGAYVPYGMGPRTCLGIKFAETEVTLALCNLLPRIKLKPSYKTQIPLQLGPAMTLSSKNGVWLDVEEIK